MLFPATAPKAPIPANAAPVIAPVTAPPKAPSAKPDDFSYSFPQIYDLMDAFLEIC